MTEKRLPENYERILRLIPLGIDNPVTNKRLKQLTGFPERTIRDIIKMLITKYRIPIGSVRGVVSGYFIPTNAEERLQGLVSIDKQAREEQRRVEILMYADLNEYKKYLGG